MNDAAIAAAISKDQETIKIGPSKIPVSPRSRERKVLQRNDPLFPGMHGITAGQAVAHAAWKAKDEANRLRCHAADSSAGELTTRQREENLLALRRRELEEDIVEPLAIEGPERPSGMYQDDIPGGGLVQHVDRPMHLHNRHLPAGTRGKFRPAMWFLNADIKDYGVSMISASPDSWNGIENAMLYMIKNATERLHLQYRELGSKLVLKALLGACERKLQVRIILDKAPRDHGVWTFYEEAVTKGLELRTYPCGLTTDNCDQLWTSCMWADALIVCIGGASVMAGGGHNYKRFEDMALLTRAEAPVKDARRQWERLWQKSTPLDAKGRTPTMRLAAAEAMQSARQHSEPGVEAHVQAFIARRGGSPRSWTPLDESPTTWSNASNYDGSTIGEQVDEPAGSESSLGSYLRL